MRSAAMPDSRATIVSASSDDCRCWVSKPAGTYWASITGVIVSTLSRRTRPPATPLSVAALAIAGLAYSASARSIGTRMFLNTCVSCGPAWKASVLSLVSRLRILAQQRRADETLEPPTPERHVGPVVDRKRDHRKTAGRQVVRQRPIGCIDLRCPGIAAEGQRQRELVQAGIVTDEHQPVSVRAVCELRGDPNDVQQFRGVGAVELVDGLVPRRVWQFVLEQLPGLARPGCRRHQHALRHDAVGRDVTSERWRIIAASRVQSPVAI